MEKRTDKLTIIIAVLATICVMLGAELALTLLTKNDAFDKISVVENMLSEYSLFDTDEEKMADYAAIAIAASVDDPYTAYYPKEEFSSFKDNILSSYVGVGAMLGADLEKDEITVVSTVEDGPAYKAGIKAGDIIIAVDGKSYEASRLTEATMNIKAGEEGSIVKITVDRPGKGKIDFDVKREKIVKKTVVSRMVTKDIGYIQITGFETKTSGADKDTFDSFKEEYQALEKNGLKKLIIDLRDNPGGDLDVVCKIADEFLPEGIITYTEDKKGKRDNIYSDKNEIDIPIVVLVNGGSASASEVLTGALKDYKKATVVGTRTYGKGIVQAVFPFSDGSGMSITTARYFTPNGECIHKIGIEPDVTVELDSDKQLSEIKDSEDNQLQKAIEILSE